MLAFSEAFLLTTGDPIYETAVAVRDFAAKFACNAAGWAGGTSSAVHKEKPYRRGAAAHTT